MINNLLEAPERGAIEAVLKRSTAGLSQAPSFERLLGFLTGAVITPGHFNRSEWLQPLFEENGIVLQDVEDIEMLMASLISLYDRLQAMKLREEKLCPFDLESAEVLNVQLLVVEWAKGLHCAVDLQEDIWIPYEGEADHIDEKLRKEVYTNLQYLTMLVDPSSIPEIATDPVPFQRNFLSHCPGWRDDMLRDTWDDKLIEFFKLFCLGRLDKIMHSLQRYATAYDEEEVVIFPSPGKRSDEEGKS